MSLKSQQKQFIHLQFPPKIQFIHLQFPPKTRKMKSRSQKISTSDEDLSSGEEQKVIKINNI
jgi:hypothetical protein